MLANRFLVASTLAAVCLTACNKAPPGHSTGQKQTVACLTYLDPSIVVEVRDGEGKSAALGARVSVLQSDRVLFSSKKGYGDSSHVAVYGRKSGPLDVQVSRPWFAPVIIKGITLNNDACGHGTVRVAATLNLLRGAPPVRQVIVPSETVSLGGSSSFHLGANVLTAPGVSTQAIWVSRNPAIVNVSPDGRATAACVPTGGEAWVVASSVADPSMKDSTRVSVEPSKYSDECRLRALGKPYIRGVITAIINGTGYRDASGPHALRYSQMKVEREGMNGVITANRDKTLVSWNPSTKIRNASGQPIGSEALKVGKIVSVWIAGPVIDTNPQQVNATDVAVEKEEP